MLKLFFILSTVLASITLTHVQNRDFEVWIDPTIKFNHLYVYNNVLNKINGEESILFSIENISGVDRKSENFYFRMPERLKPNCYYGVCVDNLKSENRIFSNRFFCAHNDEFFDDKSSSPQTKKEIKKKNQQDWLKNALLAVIIVFVIAGVITGIVYAIRKYKKKQSVRVEKDDRKTLYE